MGPQKISEKNCRQLPARSIEGVEMREKRKTQPAKPEPYATTVLVRESTHRKLKSHCIVRGLKVGHVADQMITDALEKATP
jgi:hypothetical protein